MNRPVTHRIAVSLAPYDTHECLETLRKVAPCVGLAEIRLDLMTEFDLPHIVSKSPCPLIITCRPVREGGQFAGAESERLDLLTQAMDLGCLYVDLEWDSIAAFQQQKHSRTRLIASRHWSDHMPATLWSEYEEMRERADVVKLVGSVSRATEALPILDLLRRATSPVIAIGSGDPGQFTRLLAMCFPMTVLTYGAATSHTLTAPGQLTVQEMFGIYHLQNVGRDTSVYIHLCSSPKAAKAVAIENSFAIPGEALHIAIETSPEEAPELIAGLTAHLPRATLRADTLIMKHC